MSSVNCKLDFRGAELIPAEKATDDYATRQVREYSLQSKLFESHGYTKKIRLLSKVELCCCTRR